jgi:hypothetical protein
MVALAILTWATLAALVGVFLRMAMRPDAGFGAGGERRNGRPGATRHRPRSPLAPRNDAAWAALRR